MRTRRLPQTDSIQELARFWDTHDLTDFEDQLEEVAEPAFERQTVIPLNLDSSEAEAAKRDMRMATKRYEKTRKERRGR